MMLEQNNDSISRASDLGKDQPQLNVFTREYMPPAPDHGCKTKTGCEPLYLDMSVNDPMSHPDHSANGSSTEQPTKSNGQATESSSDSSPDKQLKNLFQAVDGDGNGQLSMDEMKKAFKAADTNANGTLEASELEQLLKLSKPEGDHPTDENSGHESNHAPESPAPESPAPESPAPESHDGGSEQQPTGDHSSDHSAESQSPLQQMFNAIDKNCDGKVTPEELFAFLDTNHDGTISMDELQNFFLQLQKAMDETNSQESQPSQGEQSGNEAPKGGEDPTEPTGGTQESGSDHATPTGGTQESGSDHSAPTGGTHDSGSDQTEPTGGSHGSVPSEGGHDGVPEVPAEQPPQGSDSTKLIHIFPASDAEWQKIIGDSPKGSLIVSLPNNSNWDNDMPFSSLDSSLQKHIADASDAGLKPLGYVGTRGGTRPISEVFDEIDSWYQHSDVKGIYLGASGKPDGSGYATDPESESYFKSIASYIKARGGMAVINGGGTPNPDYMDSFDVQNKSEGYGDPPPEAAWEANYSPDRFSAIRVGVKESDILQAEDSMKSSHNGYIAVAPDFGVSAQSSDSYWNTVVDALDGKIDGQRPN